MASYTSFRCTGIVAGAVEMPYGRFVFFNVIGGATWAVGVTLAGYFLGQSIDPDVLDRYFLLILLAVIFLSALPALIHLWKEYRHDVWNFIIRKISALRGKNSEDAE